MQPNPDNTATLTACVTGGLSLFLIPAAVVTYNPAWLWYLGLFAWIAMFFGFWLPLAWFHLVAPEDLFAAAYAVGFVLAFMLMFVAALPLAARMPIARIVSRSRRVKSGA